MPECFAIIQAMPVMIVLVPLLCDDDLLVFSQIDSEQLTIVTGMASLRLPQL